jgi:hypothetical protein
MNFSRFLEARRGGSTLEAAMDSQVFWKSGGGDNKTTTTSETKSKPLQTGQYKNLLGQADAWLKGGGLDSNYGGSADFNPVAGHTQGQQQGLAGMQGTGANLSEVYNGAGTQSLQNFLGAYDPNKTGLTSAIGAANEQMQWDFDTGQAGQIRQGATDSGQFGSTRHGIAEGLARGRLNQNMANNASQMAYQDQQAYNQNQLNALGNLSAITKGLSSGSALQYDAGALEQQQQQNEILGQLDKWAYENNVDLNNLMAYKQLITGDMGGKNTTVGTQTGGGGGGSGLGTALGSIGGMAAGSFFGGMGSNMGAGLLGG